MARTSITTTTIVNTGVAIALSALDFTNGNIVDTGRVFLHVHNPTGASINVTVTPPGQIANMNIGPLIVAVPAAGDVMIGPLDPSVFGQPASSVDKTRAYVSYSATGLTGAVYSF